MRPRFIGKVVFFYALFVSVAALLHTVYDSSRPADDTSSFWGRGTEPSKFLYPAIRAGSFAEKFTTLEQVEGFAALFILLGVVAIIAKVTARNRPGDARSLRPSLATKPLAMIWGKTWSILSHLAVFLGVGFFLPLIVYLVMQDTSEFTANNAKEAMMFQVSLLIYFMGALVLTAWSSVIFGPLLVALGIGYVVHASIASIQASKGRCYRYPLTLWFLRSVEVGRLV